MASKSREYTDFPEELFAIVEHFKVSLDDKVSRPMDRKTAYRIKNNFYAFKNAISRAANLDDPYANELAETARNISVSMEVLVDDECIVTFSSGDLQKFFTLE